METQTNIDWLALARAQMAAHAGHAIRFELEPHPSVSYARIRRSLWLAALHGITSFSCSDAQTSKLMENEIRLARERLKTPFTFDVAVRDNAPAERLFPLLVSAQAACSLVGTNDSTSVKTVFRCREDDVIYENSTLVFPSQTMAVKYIQSCHMDSGLVYEKSGSIATDIFLRRFKDGTAVAINLTDKLRKGLVYRVSIHRYEFDLQPTGVIILPMGSMERMTQTSDEPFATELWQISYDGKGIARLVDTDRLTTVIDENRMGPIRYQTSVTMPRGGGDLFLRLETGGAETEILLGGQSLGVRAWDPFVWPVPSEHKGRILPLEIRVTKRTHTGYLLATPNWERH